MISLKLANDIYTKDNIEKARTAYKNIAVTKAIHKKEITNIIFLKCKYDEDRTIKEFENYLIGLENS